MGLFNPHHLSLQTAYSDLRRQAEEQSFVLVGTPGTVSTRTVNGRDFFYRQHYDANGKKAADYLGSVDDGEGQRRAREVGEQITVANSLLDVARMLARSGYVRVDARTDAVLAALANNGLFRAGGLLVGAHAYGALLNELGIRAGAQATEDIDVARDRALSLPGAKPFEQMLDDAKLGLHPIRELDRKKPSTSWKPPGADRLRVDLLVPTDGTEVKVLETRDLQAHAKGMPYLRYLLQEPLDSVVLGRSAVIPVKVPRPERLAWHKMLVSTLRRRESHKRGKDLAQAAVLVSVLAEREPGALEDAFAAVPRSVRKNVRTASAAVLDDLTRHGHEQAVAFVKELLK
jgi:hypothetical protein